VPSNDFNDLRTLHPSSCQSRVNYNGQTYRIEDAESAYQVNLDGTYTETFVVQFGQAQATITYDGVLVNGGDEARLMVTGFSMPGISLPPGYVGMVVSGSMIRQGKHYCNN
jgi:hypothetical protein